jgi:hypothetical protein
MNTQVSCNKVFQRVPEDYYFEGWRKVHFSTNLSLLSCKPPIQTISNLTFSNLFSLLPSHIISGNAQVRVNISFNTFSLDQEENGVETGVRL